MRLGLGFGRRGTLSGNWVGGTENAYVTGGSGHWPNHNALTYSWFL